MCFTWIQGPPGNSSCEQGGVDNGMSQKLSLVSPECPKIVAQHMGGAVDPEAGAVAEPPVGHTGERWEGKCWSAVQAHCGPVPQIPALRHHGPSQAQSPVLRIPQRPLGAPLLCPSSSFPRSLFFPAELTRTPSECGCPWASAGLSGFP